MLIVETLDAGERSRSRMVRSIRQHPLVWYFVLAFFISWVGVSPLVAAGIGILSFEPPSILHAFGAAGPIGAALIVTHAVSGADGVRTLWNRVFTWEGPVRWWLLAIAMPFLMFGIGCMAVRVTAGAWPVWSQLAGSAAGPAWLLDLAVASVLYGFGEETGWRGFALPRLQAKHSAMTATLVLTVFWALWHLPFFFYRFQFTGPLMIFGFFVGLFAGALWLTFLYNSTGGSILLVALWHLTWNLVNVASTDWSETVLAVLSVQVIVLAVVVVLVGGPARLSTGSRFQIPEWPA